MRKLMVLITSFLLIAACTPQATPTPDTETSTFAVSVEGAWARPARLMETSMEATEETSDMAGHEMSNMGEATEEAPAMQMSGAVSAAYMQITNNGSADVRLVSASTTVAALTQIHETTIENDIARMSELVDGLMIPAGETVEMRPGGIHVMMMNLQSSLIEGETITVTLTFDSGDTLVVEAPIQTEPPTGNE